ncbi:MAG: hypothetical protein WA208_17670 [Thermoanaerobaculia bacterium]
MQRILMLLEPDDGPVYRLIAIGRKLKQVPRGRRFWGFVDAVLNDRRDLTAVLDTTYYKIPGESVLHVPAAVAAGSGRYTLQQHGGHTHLVYTLDAGAAVEPAGDLVIHVANPDPAAWGLTEPSDLQGELFLEAEIHAPVPMSLPDHLQQRFGGRPSTPLDTVDWIDQPGAELLFTNGAE